ncbi:MAG TPA: hypothetical protein VK789_28435 [Bryobacteraceae bacterium]|jgi:hypothetical protein|nr:hypothetical protein [Bryobacteraceae bacterium]
MRKRNKATPVPAADIRAQAIRRSPEWGERLLALEAAGLLRTGDHPDFIVGGQWPTTVKGAIRRSCADCREFVALSPDSGLPKSLEFPNAPIICWPCCERRALESKLKT